jgi:hypothetical protein
MPVITQWAARAPEARGTADRTVAFGEPDPVGRRAHRCRERGRSPAGRRGRAPTARCPWWGARCTGTWGSPTSITSWSPTPTSAHSRSVSSMRWNEESGESGRARGTAACGAATAPEVVHGVPVRGRPFIRRMPMSAGPGRPGRSGARPRPAGCAPVHTGGGWAAGVRERKGEGAPPESVVLPSVPGAAEGTLEHTPFREPRRGRCQRGQSRFPGSHGGGQPSRGPSAPLTTSPETALIDVITFH